MALYALLRPAPHITTAVIELGRQEAMSVLRALSRAAESYASKNEGRFPSGSQNLNITDPFYKNRDYCGQVISGFKYECLFSNEGYTFSAIPTGSDIPRITRYTITTGGVLTSK